MTIPDWVRDAVFYQIFPDRFRNGDPANDPVGAAPWGAAPTRENHFGGDLAGVIQGLPYVQDLGCNAIYLNPIFAAGTNHRYDTHDYLKVDPALGDDSVFDELVATAHRLGIRVVLDGVFNHCGLGFAPFQDVVARGDASPYRSWFDLYELPVRVGVPPNYATCGGAHYLPRLNVSEPAVERFLHRVALHWLDRGIDGWRLDVAYEVPTGFWRRFRTAVKARHPDAYLVAEEWRSPSAFLEGDTFDGATDYELRGLILDYVARRAITGEAFLRGYVNMVRYRPAGCADGMMNVLGTHDTARIMTELGGDEDLVRVAFACLLTLPGAPLLYYGDEVGMEGANDPDCRRTFPADENEWNASLRRFVRLLVELRSRHRCLRRGEVTPVFGNDRVAAYLRAHDGQAALVVLNATELPRTLDIAVPFADGTRVTDMLGSGSFEVRDGRVLFEPLRPKSAMVLMPT